MLRGFGGFLCLSGFALYIFLPSLGKLFRLFFRGGTFGLGRLLDGRDHLFLLCLAHGGDSGLDLVHHFVGLFGRRLFVLIDQAVDVLILGRGLLCTRSFLVGGFLILCLLIRLLSIGVLRRTLLLGFGPGSGSLVRRVLLGAVSLTSFLGSCHSPERFLNAIAGFVDSTLSLLHTTLSGGSCLSQTLFGLTFCSFH